MLYYHLTKSINEYCFINSSLHATVNIVLHLKTHRLSIFEKALSPIHIHHNFLILRKKIIIHKILDKNKLTEHTLPLINSSLFDIFCNYKQAMAFLGTYIVLLIFSDFNNLNWQLSEQTFSNLCNYKQAMAFRGTYIVLLIFSDFNNSNWHLSEQTLSNLNNSNWQLNEQTIRKVMLNDFYHKAIETFYLMQILIKSTILKNKTN